MQTKKFFLSILLFTSILSSVSVWAKDKKKMLISKDEDEQRAHEMEENWQNLEWEDEDAEYIRFYGLEIQSYNRKTGEWKEVLLENKDGELVPYLELPDNRTSVKVRPSLVVGTYRYRITPYDLLSRKQEATDWIDLEIIEAFEPEVSTISPSKIYLDEYNDGLVKVTGKNLFLPEKLTDDTRRTEYILKVNALKSFKIEFIDPEKNYKINRRNNSEFLFYVNPELIPPGKYNLLATDASGLINQKNTSSEFEVRFKKRVDLDVSLGYGLPFIVYDGTFDEFMNSRVWPLTAVSKITFMPFKRKWGYFGAALNGSYTRMNTEFDSYKIDGNLVTAHLDFVYQKVLNKKTVWQDPLEPEKQQIKFKHIANVELHAGAGFTYFMDYVFHFDHDVESEHFDSTNISVNVGGAFQLYFTKRFYTEGNVDFVAAFTSGMSYGMIIPSISAGWQF